MSFLSKWKRQIAAGAAALGLVGGGVAIQRVGFVFPGYNGNVTTTTTTTTTTTSPFSAGVCSPSPCTQTSEASFTITNVPDSSAPPYALSANTPVTASKTLFIERPGNLQSSPAPPLVIGTFGSVSGNTNWQAAAAKYGFVFVQLNPYNVAYHAISAHWDGIHLGPTSSSHICGSLGNFVCDEIPWVVKALDAVECPYTGSGTCQGVNTSEVFTFTSSNGNLANDIACDTRTSSRIAGYQTVSDDMIGAAISGFGTDTHTTALPPNCAGILGVSAPFGTNCFSDCLTGSNHDMAIQLIGGTSDSLFPSLFTGGTFTCGPSVTPSCWEYSYPDLAGADSRGPGAAMGCPTTPASAVTRGITSQVLVSTYTPCSNSSSPTQAAVQVVKITGGGHVLDTWPIGANAAAYIANPSYVVNGICVPAAAGTCTDLSGHAADGVSNPDIAWNFWTTYFK